MNLDDYILCSDITGLTLTTEYIIPSVIIIRDTPLAKPCLFCTFTSYHSPVCCKRACGTFRVVESRTLSDRFQLLYQRCQWYQLILHAFGSWRLLSCIVSFTSVGALAHAPNVSGREKRGSSEEELNAIPIR